MLKEQRENPLTGPDGRTITEALGEDTVNRIDRSRAASIRQVQEDRASGRAGGFVGVSNAHLNR